MIIIGPFALAFILALLFRPLRMLLGYCATVLLILAIGAFGHVDVINDNVWLAPLLALIVFTPKVRRRRV